MSKPVKVILSILKIIGLIILCLAAAFAIVWPLWKFATSASKIYTTIVLILLAALIIYWIVRKIIRKAKHHV